MSETSEITEEEYLARLDARARAGAPERIPPQELGVWQTAEIAAQAALATVQPAIAAANALRAKADLERERLDVRYRIDRKAGDSFDAMTGRITRKAVST